jgi:hypothetical protein
MSFVFDPARELARQTFDDDDPFPDLPDGDFCWSVVPERASGVVSRPPTTTESGAAW